MVSTRGQIIAHEEASLPDPQPAVTPIKASQEAPRSQTTVSTTPNNEDDRIWAEKYRAMLRQEREAANRNMFSRVHHRVTLMWHHFRISMVPFMLDPWEQALYIIGIVILFYGLVHAIQQSMGLIASYKIAWPSTTNHSTESARTLSGWIAALRPRIIKYLNNA